MCDLPFTQILRAEVSGILHFGSDFTEMYGFDFLVLDAEDDFEPVCFADALKVIEELP